MVEATSVSVQTTESQVGQTVNMKDIDTLPQLGRAPLALAVFAPGVAVFQQGSSAGSDSSYSHVNGLRQGSNNNTLDGIDVNDAVTPRMGLSLTQTNTDSVGEVHIITEGGKAEYGRNAGGQVEMITRSGTNNYHGNLFDYLRNTDLNANDFFSNKSGVPRPLFIQNLFGGSMGGPIRHNKLFIFGNYQGQRTHQLIVRNRVVPTDLAKQGIFQWIPPGSTAVQQYNIITADPLRKGIDPFIANLLKNYPSPNNFDVGDKLNSAGYRFNNANGSLGDQFTIKADYNVTSSQHIFFRDSWYRTSSIDGLNNADAPFPGLAQGTQGGHRWGVAAGWDWSITPTMISEFRYGHQSAGVAFVRPERIAGPMVFQNPWNDLWYPPLLPNYAQGRNSPVNEWTDNITKVHGNHTFKFGGNLRFTKQYGYNAANIYPNIDLSLANGNAPSASVNPPGAISSTDLATFQGLYNNLLGRVSQISQTYYSDLQTFQGPGTPRVRNFIFHDYGFFGQDDWKITRNLTLNLGLRWEFSGVPYEQNGLAGTLDKVAQLNTVSQLDNITINKGGQWYNNDWNNFAPRVGIAWDPKGDGKMAIRSNFGIFYDRLIGSVANSVDGNTPGFSTQVAVMPNSVAGNDVRISDNPPGPVAPPAPQTLVPVGNRATTIQAFNPNLRTGYVAQWNFTVQREIARNTTLQAAYVATHGVKLYFGQDLNQDRIYGDFLTAFQQMQAYVANKTAPPASNTLVRIFGSPDAAVTAIGSSVFTTGQVRLAADTVDRSNNSKYAAAGLNQFYLRNYPQFNQVYYGTNMGRSYYNSLQVSLRHQVGALKFFANYTWSKSIDNVLSTATGGEGNGFSEPIDSYNVALNRARSNFDIPHVFNFASTYTLPIGKGHALGGNMPQWANALLGGWDLGGIWVWDSGAPFTVSTARLTGPSNQLTTTGDFADYTGSRNIGSVSRQGNGVYYFTPAEIANFSNPAAGSIGNSGRNAFRGPRYFNVDVSLVKKFAITEKHHVTFRAEAYNLFNNVPFGVNTNNTNISSTGSFGQLSTVVGAARFMQMALRYDF
jgi:hypothetical protein